MTRPQPKEDFYAHVNHSWLSDPKVTIPDEYPRWGSFIQLHDESLKNQVGMVKELLEKANPNVDEKKLAMAWEASMRRFDEWGAGKGDYSAVIGELEALETHFARGKDGIAEYFARGQEFGISVPFSFDKECNLEDSQNMVLDFSPSGLSLPSRDYYLDDKFAEQRKLFLAHLENVAGLIGPDRLQENFSARVMKFETKLAMISMKKDQSRQYDKYYTITTLDDLVEKVNDLRFLQEKLANYSKNEIEEDQDILCEESCLVSDEEMDDIRKMMETIFERLGLRKVMEANYAKNYPGEKGAEYRVMCFDGDYIRRVLKLLIRESNWDDLFAYLQYKVILSGSAYCTKDLDEEVFDFHSRKLNGQNAQKSPEKRSIALINSWLGELLGKIYVGRYFSEQDKENVTGMINDVLKVMEHSIQNNDWLTEPTKDKALEKLSGFKMKIGYPDKWKDFDGLSFSEGESLFEMRKKVTAFQYQTELLDKVNAPKDKTEWSMTPQTVNAYYNPLMNEIVFPAAIIQPPFYLKGLSDIDFELDDEEKAIDESLLLAACNFGGIGAVIAHEITHGFDNQGKKFSASGNLENWWTPEDDALFESKSQIMRTQAELWEFKDSSSDGSEEKVHKINGELTLGENLADLGGMSLGCKGLQRRLIEEEVPEHLHVPLFRVFFKSWACIWKSKETKEFIIMQLNTDPHSPCSFRANLVKNVDIFYDVFQVNKGDSMYLPKELRVQMW